jgi:hypothetical protein
MRRMAYALALLPALTAHADVIDIVWQDGGRFERTMSVAPGRFAEFCGALRAGQTVDWSFEAEGALDFNIHFHVGKDVRYPARMEGARKSRGALAVDAPQDYCWMWTNKSAAATRLSVGLVLK